MAEIDDRVKEDILALQEEMAIVSTPGWQRRLQWVTELFQVDANRLTFGEIKDDRDRLQAEGRCQAFRQFLARDGEITAAFEELRRDQDPEVEQEEGGDHGVFYEAAQ